MGLYPGAATWHPNITTVDDGPDRDAMSVNLGIEGLADRTVWLRDNAGLLADDNVWTGNNVFANTGGYLFIQQGTGLRLPVAQDLIDTPTQTIGPDDGLFFRVPLAAGPNIIRLKDTSPVPANGIVIRIFFPYASTGAASWAVRRESGGGSNILRFDNTGYANDLFTFADFQMQPGGWRCIGACGTIVAGPHF